jgi:uncharacterized protein (DUF924 family)
MTAPLPEDAAAVLRFWLEEVPPEQRFARDDTLDAECERRFGALREQVVASHAAGWRGSPRAILAAIILADQFSRNIFRGDPRAYAADPLGRALAREALIRGWDAGLSPYERQFLYLPFMHGETMADQVVSLALFNRPGLEMARDFAVDHAREIALDGRFKGRDAALGR